VPDEGDDRQRFLDRCFEFLKHVTTLSTAAALLILAIYRETPFKEGLLALTLILLGLGVVVSVLGMLVISLGSLTPPNQTAFSDKTQDTIIRSITNAAGGIFIGSVSGLAFVILDVPFRYAIGIMLALLVLLTGALLFVRRIRRRQVSAVSTSSVEITKELRRQEDEDTDNPPEQE
jgi:hypothetical protein